MTALNEYQRLEATAIWRPDPEAQRRDVFVSLGDATLVIHDGNEMALSHWSLPAISRHNPGHVPALYAPGQDSPELLEISDATMIEAIERVHKAVSRGRSRPGRLRLGIILAVMALVVALGLFWAPDALIRQTAAIVPDATRAGLSRDLMAQLRPLTGAPCSTPQGDRALARLAANLLPDGSGRLVVLPTAITEARHLPDGTILLGRSLVEDFETPDVVAGYVLAESQRMSDTDPMAALLRDAGIGAAFRLLTSGALTPTDVKVAAQSLVSNDELPALSTASLASRFAARGVSTRPYAYALDITGETVLDLIEADTARDAEARPILSDDAWVALQSICGA